MKKDSYTKIVATIGPASSDYKTIKALFNAGVDVFRMNFSHGSHEDHAERLAIIRKVEEEVGPPNWHSCRPAGAKAAHWYLCQWRGEPETRPGYCTASREGDR